ncbi:MAG: DUF2703 domain-containing protein [Candidatus Paceibacteria bacterium]
MTVQLLHNKECHIWKKVLEELRALGVEPEVILVKNDEDALRYRFFGSPQILVDGRDIDPMASQISNYHTIGCRLYIWKGKVYEYPPREMLMKALFPDEKK